MSQEIRKVQVKHEAPRPKQEQWLQMPNTHQKSYLDSLDLSKFSKCHHNFITLLGTNFEDLGPSASDTMFQNRDRKERLSQEGKLDKHLTSHIKFDKDDFYSCINRSSTNHWKLINTLSSIPKSNCERKDLFPKVTPFHTHCVTQVPVLIHIYII